VNHSNSGLNKLLIRQSLGDDTANHSINLPVYKAHFEIKLRCFMSDQRVSLLRLCASPLARQKPSQLLAPLLGLSWPYVALCGLTWPYVASYRPQLLPTIGPHSSLRITSAISPANTMNQDFAKANTGLAPC
jgi:hypothetical protein